MFGKLFGGKKADAAKAQTPLTISLNAKLQPMHRGELFEDPLDERLKAAGIGHVCGGGTALTELGEVASCDIELNVVADDDRSIDAIVDALDRLGATKGSKIVFHDGRPPRAFGSFEGLALYLNGTDLPDEVYAQCDSNHVYAEVERLIEGHGMIMSHWQGPTETALYLHGAAFETMRERISGFLESYPLCAKCRVVRTA